MIVHSPPFQIFTDPRMRHLTGFSSLVATAVLLAGCEKEAAELPAPPPPTVEVIEVRPEEATLTRELPGRTNPFVVAEVRPQVTGIVEERLFEEGSMVEAGDVLYRLDDATYRAEFNRAQAGLVAAQAALELARINAERTRGLLESNAISQQEYDNAMAALRQAEAEVGVAEAAAESARVLLGYTKIISPVSGRIGRSSVTRGALVTANQTQALATVQQLDPIYVDLTQSSREMLAFRRALAAGNISESEELPVTIVLEDGSNYDHPGKVAFAESRVDPSTGSYLLRVVVPNPDQLLLPGMYVRGVVGIGVREKAILVPQQAIQRGPGGNSTVLLVRADNTVESRSVVVGQSIGNRSVIEQGLLPGDRVIVQGVQKVQPGVRVQVMESSPEANVAQ